MGITKTGLKAALIATALTGVLAADAGAATVSASGQLTFNALPGETNDVNIAVYQDTVRGPDVGTIPVPYWGCRPAFNLSYGPYLDCRDASHGIRPSDIRVTAPSRLLVTDPGAPLTAGPGCIALSSHSASCQYSQSLSLTLGDGADSVSNLPLAATIDGGAGRDSLGGSPGNDTFLVRDGGDDTVQCGSGAWDVVTADRKDSVGRDCESVTRG